MITYRQPFRGDFPISQQYGEIVPGVTYKGQPHTGIDYACPVGTPVLASADGTVQYAEWDNFGYGYCVILLHPDGKGTVYAHLASISVKEHQQVKQGDVIGTSGQTGNVTGPHLHFEARSKWFDYKTHEDPVTFLPLMSFADSAGEDTGASEGTSQILAQTSQKLREPDQLGEAVEISAPAGAWGWSKDFSKRSTVFPCGTRLHFTGTTTQRLGYTYCEVYPEPVTFWVAVHDGETQILDNA